MIGRWLRKCTDKYRRRRQRLEDNYRFLREAADREGETLEALPYETLRNLPDEYVGYSKTIDGIECRFSADVYEEMKNGDLSIGLDINADLPTKWGVKPSYNFYKRPDGSVYY